jgi:hypothetical protein
MNERIQELAVQARQEFLELPTGYTPEQVGMYPQLMEKFAKLIVSECMDVLDPGENQVIARFQARQWLAEHFGDE